MTTATSDYTDANRARVVLAEAKRLEQFLASLSPEGWQRQSACEQWRVADVVAHLTVMQLAERIERAKRDVDAPPPDEMTTGSVDEDGFRRGIAEKAIDLSSKLGDDLLPKLIADRERLEGLLSEFRPEDWDIPCQHPMGPEPVRTWVDILTTETCMHAWDIRSRFDPEYHLSEDSLPALFNTIPRAIRRAFRPDPARTPPTRYRFVVDGTGQAVQDIVLDERGGRRESPGITGADVTFRCSAETFILVMFGRLRPGDALSNRRLTYDGPERVATAFGRAFVGG
jgi:uncharacterized protein (TIGR03083 family)